MSKIQFAASVDALLRGADTVLVVAPARSFSKAKLSALPDSLRDLAIDLARDVRPGDLGATASTLTGNRPRSLQVGVLPNTGSHYNSPARAESIRKVVAAARLRVPKKAAVFLVLDSADHLVAAVNAVGRALPLYSAKAGATRNAPAVALYANDKSGAKLTVDKIARETMASAREAARLVDSPPTDLNPEAMARAARAMLRGVPHVKFKEIRGDALLTAKLRGVHAVGRTAVKAPRVVIATYSPPRAKKGHIALVGKGITYDTGGLHLKARGAMETMKADMGGAAAVLGAFRTLTVTGVKRKISMILCLAENAIGPTAYKPDDILTMHSGLTVEINNTDAEGRIVLADGVSYAARVLHADTIFDAATLTGAQLIATGNLHAAVVSNATTLERIAVAAGTRSGDLTHPLPFAPEFYKQEFASPVADMRNSVKNRSNAQASCAGQFIYWHIQDTKARWLHVDLAGPAFRSSRATGFGVALLAECVRSL